MTTKEISERKNDNILKNALSLLAVVILSVFATRSRIGGYLSFVNVGVTALSGIWGVFSFFASALTYIIGGDFNKSFVQLSAMMIIVVIKLFSGKNLSPAKNAVLVVCSLVFCSLTASFAIRTSGYLFVYRIFFSLFCGCLVYFADKTIRNFTENKKLELYGTRGAAVGILFVVLVATFCSLNLFTLNIGRTLGIVAVILISKKYGASGGAVCGAITTFGVLMYSPELAVNTMFLCACGLVCGAASKLGSITMIISFLSCAVIGLVATGFNSDTFPMLTDIAVGSVITVAMPMTAEREILNALKKKRNNEFSVGENIAMNINVAAGTIGNVRERLNEISTVLEQNSNYDGLLGKVKKEACEECEFYNKCWKEKAGITQKRLKKAENILLSKGSMSDDAIGFCENKKNLAEIMESAHSEMLCAQASRQKSAELRELLSQQLFATQMLLGDLSKRTISLTETDDELSQKVSDLLIKKEIHNAKVCVYSDTNKAKRVEIFLSKKPECDMVKLTVELSGVLDCEMEMPVTFRKNGVIKLVFSESAHFGISSGVSQISSVKDDYCGDTLERIWLSPTEFMIVLSDGMGTGKTAKLDSSFAANLISRFATSGFSPETSLTIINSILRVKGWDESFATADIAVFDLCRGMVRFIKSGASPSYILRDGNLIKIDCDSFPLGILSETTSNAKEYKLFEGDRIIITSDGVEEKTVRKASDAMSGNRFSSHEASEYISLLSSDTKTSLRKDDISVCVADVFIK